MLALISHTLLLFKVLSCLQQFEIHSNWPEWWLNTFRFVLPGLAFALLSDYLRWFEYSNNSLLWCPCSAGGSSSTDLHFIIWSVLPWLLTCSEAFLCVLSVQIVLRAWKKKTSTSLGFFWRCFKTFLFPRCNKKSVGHSSYQPTGETTVRHCPTSPSSESLRSPEARCEWGLQHRGRHHRTAL